MKLTKLDAVRMQLDTAIRLFFEDSDPVSPHTLAWAAFEVLNGVWRHRQKRGGMKQLSPKEHMESYVRPEHLEEFRKRTKQPYNFFKHANQDPEAVLDNFNDLLTFVILLAAIQTYQQLGHPLTTNMLVFLTWVTVAHPNVITFEQPEKQSLEAAAAQFAGLPDKETKQIALELLQIAPRVLKRSEPAHE